jgi:energy-coupling factor transport system permease protein
MLISKTAPQKQRWLADINPLAKIVVSLIITSIAFSLRSLWAVGLLVSVLLLLLLMSVQIKLKTILVVTFSLVVFTAIATWLLNNFQFALLNSLRLVAIFLPTPLLAMTTPPADLVRALQAAKLPSFLILSLMLVWRFLPLIQQEAQRILDANLLRGVDLTRQPQQWFSGLFVPLIFRIVSYADEVTVGLETRGYDPNAPRSISQPLTWRIGDITFIVGSVMLTVIIMILNSMYSTTMN